MIPLRDSQPSERVPLINYALIGLCGLGFWLEFFAGSDPEQFVQRYALFPAQLLERGNEASYLNPQLYVPILTSMFLHAGILHFLGNMLFLWIFGDNVEDRFGHLGYAIFYLLGGLAAGLAHVAANPTSSIPTVGASGSIAAVMGAYVVLYPRARVESVLVLFVFIRFVSVPAAVYLGLWFLLQVIHGSGQLAQGATGGGVAWWAHAGGFLFGAVTIGIVGRRRTRRRR